jgi:hypothetical protein
MGVVAATAHAPAEKKFFASFFQKRSASFFKGQIDERFNEDSWPDRSGGYF